MKNIFFLSLLIFIIGCGDDSVTEVPVAEQISTYIAENNLSTIETGSGLHVAIENAGGAVKPNIFNTITIDYVGTYVDGEVFDSGNGFTSVLAGLIQGWQEGIPFFGQGGKGTLIIPPLLAYGENPTNVRANAVLVFEIELLDFN